MAPRIEMHEVNCRVIREEGSRVTLDLASRKDPVTLPRSWIALRPRKPNPRNIHSYSSVRKYPTSLRMPLALAREKGIA